MSSMVERVAIAVRDEIGRQFNAKPLPDQETMEHGWAATGGEINCEDLARAAIKALMEPTQKMHESGVVATQKCHEEGAWQYSAYPRAGWPAMLTAALEEDDG